MRTDFTHTHYTRLIQLFKETDNHEVYELLANDLACDYCSILEAKLIMRSKSDKPLSGGLAKYIAKLLADITCFKWDVRIVEPRILDQYRRQVEAIQQQFPALSPLGVALRFGHMIAVEGGANE